MMDGLDVLLHAPHLNPFTSLNKAPMSGEISRPLRFGACVFTALVLCGLQLESWTSPVSGEDAPPATPAADALADRALQILETHCVECHGGKATRHGLDLTSREGLLRGGDIGPAIVSGKGAESPLVQRLRHDVKPGMPYKRDRLSDDQIAAISDWINAGSVYGRSLRKEPAATTETWWSLRPLQKTPPPTAAGELATWPRNPIDAFVLARLQEKGLAPSAETDRRTWLRRVTFDLIGLAPTAEALAEFLADESPQAYERVVDRLLGSPQYGERWARHWMDVVHYAETHGNDQDRPRPNAWPYRDYLIRSFNSDKPYAQFAAEQIAGDVLLPNDPQGIVATGLIATGPWDESSLMSIMEDTLDRQIARYLDRDDMLTTVMSTFVSTTVHCARCHDHKFDPVSQADYYSLQAVFAGVDKGDRSFEPDPATAARRRELLQAKARLESLKNSTDASLLEPSAQERAARWEQEVGSAVSVWRVLDPDVYAGTSTAFTKQADLSLIATGPRPETDTYTITATSDLSRITGVRVEVLSDESLPKQGPGRQDNGNLHLSEFRLQAAPVADPAASKPVALRNPQADFNQEGWTIAHALDGNKGTAWGVYPKVSQSHEAAFELVEPLQVAGGARLTFVLEQLHGGGHLIGRVRLSVTSATVTLEAWPPEVREVLAVSREARTDLQRAELARFVLLRDVQSQLVALPALQMVYAAANQSSPELNRPAQAPRAIHVLRRGDVNQPGEAAQAGTLACVPGLESRFQLENPQDEGARRAALARWVADSRNVLTWRSIVNRVWHYHFGRGIVDTPNDLGRMGSLPTHPELLDWLTVTLRENGGSLKSLHKLIVLSATYRQASRHNPQYAEIDAENRLLWRMNRLRLDAESLRDAILQTSGLLDPTLGGPSVKQFIQTPGIHVTPMVDYLNFNVDAPESRRRSVYRFIFRTLPDPFMETLDCADSSQLTPARNVSVSALQALSMLNNHFLVRQCEHIADRVRGMSGDLPGQVAALYEVVLGRAPTSAELQTLVGYATRHGLANACRVLLNSNEFMFVN